ncbi:TPA: hypothetical protein ENS27_14930 [bacterium]|nr:hypothetical protein [bacterium]
MKIFKYIVTILLILFAQISAYGAFENVDYGARSLGMGSAYVSIADDPSAVFWNVAGITNLNKRELEMSYMILYDLVSFSYISYAQDIKNGNVGVGIISSSDADGIYREMEFIVCYGKKIFDDLSIGSGIKYLSSEANLGDTRLGNGKGFAIDLGLQYRPMGDDINLGLRLRNLIGYVSYNRNAIMEFTDRKYSELPDFSYAFGISADINRFFPIIKDTILALEIMDNDFRTGMEYTFRDTLSIRTGLRFGNALDRAITAGFGVKVSSIRLDFAYVSSAVGAPTSQFSMSIAW